LGADWQIGVTSSDVIFTFEYPSLTNAFGNGKAHRALLGVPFSFCFVNLKAWGRCLIVDNMPWCRVYTIDSPQ